MHSGMKKIKRAKVVKRTKSTIIRLRRKRILKLESATRRPKGSPTINVKDLRGKKLCKPDDRRRDGFQRRTKMRESKPPRQGREGVDSEPFQKNYEKTPW